MDKKSEIARRTGSRTVFTAEPAATAPTTASATASTTASAAQTAAVSPPTGWWMYHGDPAHTGYVSDSALNCATIKQNGGTSRFQTLHTLYLDGPVLSVPAVTNGFIYVGLANYQKAKGGNGGALHKIKIDTGEIVNTFHWDLDGDRRDAHSFAGMGCTPAVINGRVYFGAFNGKVYCLDEETLKLLWVTDLRNPDPDHNQPIRNTANPIGDPGNPANVDPTYPAAVIWSSPVVKPDGTKLYVGCGEGENPALFSFVFCLDALTGNVDWIFCTNQFDENQPNQPNVLPLKAVGVPNLPPQYSTSEKTPVSMGCSVWGAIAYDTKLNCLFCPTGNQQPEPNDDWVWRDGDGNPVTDYTNPSVAPPPFKPELPGAGYSNGVLKLDADTGQFLGFVQVPVYTNYRPSDTDIDVGGAPIIYEYTESGTPYRYVGFGCKNGSFIRFDPNDMTRIVGYMSVLPYHRDGTQIETVDRHPNPEDVQMNPPVPNDISNKVPNENFSGIFNTAAFCPATDPHSLELGNQPHLFVGIGGPNYHNQSPGIDYETTPFLRALDIDLGVDDWPVDYSADPAKYVNGSLVDPDTTEKVGLYSTAGESGLGSPAVVNDVVFCATSKVSIYAFDVRDGTLLWYDDLGSQTGGYNGGYGYCLGPAIWQNYVVAGALIFGQQGGILKIYGLAPETGS